VREKMADEGINWKIKVRRGEIEVEVIGVADDWTYKTFKELEKKYL
jgi:hypothetical protein